MNSIEAQAFEPEFKPVPALCWYMSYILVYGDNWTNTGYCFENVNKLKLTDLFVCSDARVQFPRSSNSEIRDLRHNFESSADNQNPKSCDFSFEGDFAIFGKWHFEKKNWKPGAIFSEIFWFLTIRFLRNKQESSKFLEFRFD